MVILLYVAFALLFAAYTALEIIVGKKRGARLSCIRLISVAIAAVLAVLCCVIAALILIKPGFLGLPKELVPLAKDIAKSIVLPIAILVVFVVFKLISLIGYAIAAGAAKKGKHAAECTEIDKKSSIIGMVLGGVISLIVTGFLVIPALRITSIYKDYDENKDNIMTLVALVRGEKISTSELITSVDDLSSYILSMDYVSDEAKVKALNYAIETVNKKLKESGNAAMGGLEFNTYSSLSKHKKQISSLVDVAKSLDKAGLVADISTSGIDASGISEEKLLDAVSSEDTAKDFVDAVSKLDNGGEVLADMINGVIAEKSNNELKNIIDEDVLRNIDANKNAVVKTLTLAESFKSMSEEEYSKMGVEERRELIDQIYEIMSYGVVDANECMKIIGNIRRSIGE